MVNLISGVDAAYVEKNDVVVVTLVSYHRLCQVFESKIFLFVQMTCLFLIVFINQSFNV